MTLTKDDVFKIRKLLGDYKTDWIVKNQEDVEQLERVNSLFAELEIPPPYDLWLAESLQIRERLKKLPMGLILQHIRDSYSYDKHVMRKEAQEKTEKCLQDLRELQEILEGEK